MVSKGPPDFSGPHHRPPQSPPLLTTPVLSSLSLSISLRVIYLIPRNHAPLITACLSLQVAFSRRLSLPIPSHSALPRSTLPSGLCPTPPCTLGLLCTEDTSLVHLVLLVLDYIFVSFRTYILHRPPSWHAWAFYFFFDLNLSLRGSSVKIHTVPVHASGQ